MQYFFSDLYSRPRLHIPNQKLWKGTNSLCFPDRNKKWSTEIKLTRWSGFSPASPCMGTEAPGWWCFLQEPLDNDSKGAFPSALVLPGSVQCQAVPQDLPGGLQEEEEENSLLSPSCFVFERSG